MKAIYIFFGFAGGIVSIYLLFDAWLICFVFSQNKFICRARSSALFKYQVFGSLVGLVFFISGPLMTLHGNIGCKFGEATPQFLDPTYENKKGEALECMINRFSVFTVTAILNLVFVCVSSTLYDLQKASSGNHTRTESRIVHKRGEQFALCLSLVEPILLAVVTAQLDKEGTIMEVAKLARWSVTCGPRLTGAQEVMLVHLPMILPALGVMAQSCRVFATIRGVKLGLENSNSDASVSEGDRLIKDTLQMLAKSVAHLGLRIVFLLLLFSCTTYITFKGLQTSSSDFADWVLCKLFPGVVASSLSVNFNVLVRHDSCEHVKVEIGSFDIPPDRVPFESKVQPFVFTLSLGAQGLVVLVYGLYFLRVAKHRARTYKRLASKRVNSFTLSKLRKTGTVKVVPKLPDNREDTSIALTESLDVTRTNTSTNK
jgi:hypothetical protein